MNIEIAKRIEAEIQNIPTQDLSYGVLDETKGRDSKILSVIKDFTKQESPLNSKRIQDEFLGLGPIQCLIDDESVSEILILAYDKICFEKNGRLQKMNDSFCSVHTFRQFIERVCTASNSHFNIERPMTNGKFLDFRLHIVGSEITQNSHALSLRRHPKSPWNFDRLLENSWCSQDQLVEITKVLDSKSNFLVVGGTGTGKTSFLNACLQKISNQDRMIIIEDTSELTIPNVFSTKLITRVDANGILPSIDQSELVKQSLRMRPDRLVMGEIRGPEAKDLLMALSTGHEGSFGSLHASSASQALIRLEMLIQLGAPFWSLSAIRQLIKLSLQYIFVVTKNPEGFRKLQGLYCLRSLEDMGILLERVF